MSKPGTPTQSTSTLILRRQLTELAKHPVEGFSAGQHTRPGARAHSADGDALQGLLTTIIFWSGRF